MKYFCTSQEEFQAVLLEPLYFRNPALQGPNPDGFSDLAGRRLRLLGPSLLLWLRKSQLDLGPQGLTSNIPLQKTQSLIPPNKQQWQGEKTLFRKKP